MRRILLIAFLLLTSWVFAQRTPAETVRVRLFSQEQPSVLRIITLNGSEIVLNAGQMKTPFRSDGPVRIQRGDSVLQLPYPIEVSKRNSALLILMRLPVEEYVAAVLAGESGGFRSEESMKAMALAARTYAAHFRHRHESEGFDFCDSTHCQDLRITAVTNRLRKAVEATAGELLQYDGRPIAAYYHQNCGGITEARAPYLIQMKDRFCTSLGRRSWSTELTAADLQSALGVRDLHNIEVVERTASGRAQRLRITGSEARLVDAEAFRLAIGRRLGWNRIRSDLYDVRRDGAGFVFEGYGAGHGIGLCQVGAAVMGEMGHNYREILAYYFPGATIARSHP